MSVSAIPLKCGHQNKSIWIIFSSKCVSCFYYKKNKKKQTFLETFYLKCIYTKCKIPSKKSTNIRHADNIWKMSRVCLKLDKGTWFRNNFWSYTQTQVLSQDWKLTSFSTCWKCQRDQNECKIVNPIRYLWKYLVIKSILS